MRAFQLALVLFLTNIVVIVDAQNNIDVLTSKYTFDNLGNNEIKQDLSCFVHKASCQTQNIELVPLNSYYSDSQTGISLVFFDERSVFSDWGISISLQEFGDQTIIERIGGFVHGKVKFHLPKSAIDDIPNPYFSVVNTPHWLTGRSKLRKPIIDNWKVFKSKTHNYIYIYFENKQEGYEVTWVINNNREYITRVIDKLN